MARFLALLAFLCAPALPAQFDNTVIGAPEEQPPATDVDRGSTDHFVLAFSLGRPLADGSDVFTGLAVRNLASAGASDFVRLRLWRDVDGDEAFNPSIDTPVAEASSNGFPVSFGAFASAQTIPAQSSVGYFITIDISPSAASGADFQLRILPDDVAMSTHGVTDMDAYDVIGNVHTVVGSPAQILHVVQSPTGAHPGQPFTGQPRVELRDADGELRTDDNITIVTASITSGTGAPGATLGGALTATASAGVATFQNLQIDLAGAGYRLIFTAANHVNALSDPFDVGTPQTPTQLALTAQPTGGIAGDPFGTQPVVEVRDGEGNPVSHSVTVTAALSGGTPGASLLGTVAVPTVDGVATFTNLGVSHAGSGYVISFSAPGLSGTSTAPFQVEGSDKPRKKKSGGCAVGLGASLWWLALPALVALRRRRR